VAITIAAALVSYVVMLLAMYLRRIRSVHVPMMIGIMIFDFLFPVYLYMNRDWPKRLFEEGDIFSFLLWTHFGLLISLFVLYVIQGLAGRQLLQGEQHARTEHRNVAIGILLVRGLVILSGALLYKPEA